MDGKDSRGRDVTRLIVGLMVALGVWATTAAAAQASTVRGTPLIRGAGTVTATAYSCVNFNQDDRFTKSDCAQRVLVESPFTSSSITFTATPSSTPVGHWRFVGWTGCTETDPVARTCTISSSFFGDETFTPTVVFDDFVAPTVTTLTASQSVIEDRRFFFYFGSNEVATYQCRLGSEPFGACSSGEARTLPSEGSFTFDVRPIDASGNAGTVMSRQVTAVDTAISGGPSGPTNATSASFDFTTGAGIAFECRLDGAAFAPCGTGTSGSKSLTGLSEGVHTFQVRARNGDFVDRVPATRTWTVDVSPPDTAITSGPLEGAVTTLTTAAFAFESTEPADATFECRLDGGAFGPCTSPENLTALPAGPRRFEVRARDAAGNVDPTPASRSWSVQAPDGDGDGYNAAVDCDDADRNVHPGRTDIPDNGVDEDCSGADAVDPDRDGDGVQRPADCNDGNPAIRPGAADVPGNGIDEDCSGGDTALTTDAPPPTGTALTTSPPRTMSFTLRFRAKVSRTFTRLRRFTINGAPIGAKVTVRCKGRKCPKRTVRFTITKAKQPVKGLVGKKLRKGSRLTITVTHGGFVTGVQTLKIGKRKPRVGSRMKCLPAGAKRPQAC